MSGGGAVRRRVIQNLLPAFFLNPFVTGTGREEAEELKEVSRVGFR